MSRGYGVDIYGVDTYGYSQPVDYSVGPFTASESDYGEITLNWNSLNTTTWKYMVLVRSTYGYPSRLDDGQTILTIYPSAPVRTYTDANLTPGTIYYYTIFVATETPSWNNTTTYPTGSTVLYNGKYYSALFTTTGATPNGLAAPWFYSSYAPVWYVGGYTSTLALTNTGYGTYLYNRTPQPYKITTSDTFSDKAVDNQSLQNYLNVLGYGLDQLKNQYDQLLQVNNPDVISSNSLDLLGRQLGINTDYLSSPQLRRERVKNATVNYQMKGETQSIHNLVAELTGWDCTIVEGKNTMPNGDYSRFAHPIYDTWNANVTYFPNQLVAYGSYNYKCLVQAVGTAQAPTGSNSNNTWWQWQNNVLDTTSLKNPGTGGYSGWRTVFSGGYTGNIQGLATSLPSVLTSFSGQWNGLQFNQTNTTGELQLWLGAPLSTPTWTNATNYSIGSYVLYNSVYYKALRASGPADPHGFITPGTNDSFWQAFYYTTSDLPNNRRDTIVLPPTQQWSSAVQYAQDTQVVYNGILYQAAQDNINSAPSGYYYSNASWIFISLPETAVTSGMYFCKPGTDTTASWSAVVDSLFFDSAGNQINTFNQVNAGFTARFMNDSTDLNGTVEAEMYSYSTVNGSAGPGQGWTSSWTTTTGSPNFGTTAPAGSWKSKYGMAYVDQTISGTTAYNILFGTNRLEGTGQPLNNNLFVTFATDFADTAHYGHGIAFGSISGTGQFYYATRQGLRSYNAGTDTQIATWTRLKDGDRIMISANGTAISVYKYNRDGTGNKTLLASVTGAFSIGANAGIIQKYSATGAV